MSHVALRCPHCGGHLNPPSKQFECYQDDGCSMSHWICNEESGSTNPGCKRTFCIQVKQNDDGSPWIITSAFIELYAELVPIKGRPGSLYNKRTELIFDIRDLHNSGLKAKSNYHLINKENQNV